MAQPAGYESNTAHDCNKTKTPVPREDQVHHLPNPAVSKFVTPQIRYYTSSSHTELAPEKL